MPVHSCVLVPDREQALAYPTGEIRLNFHEDHTRFADRVDTEPERDPDDAMVAGGGFR